MLPDPTTIQEPSLAQAAPVTVPLDVALLSATLRASLHDPPELAAAKGSDVVLV
jgi:hypothetical protein